VGTIIDPVIRGIVDGAGRLIGQRVNTPMTPMAAAGMGAFSGITVANRVAADGLLSIGGGASVAVNVALGAFMLRAGQIYNKPYFATVGQAMLVATAVGVGFGLLTHGQKLIPELQVNVKVGDH
jgi:hypothetical protein